MKDINIQKKKVKQANKHIKGIKYFINLSTRLQYQNFYPRLFDISFTNLYKKDYSKLFSTFNIAPSSLITKLPLLILSPSFLMISIQCPKLSF